MEEEDLLDKEISQAPGLDQAPGLKQAPDRGLWQAAQGLWRAVGAIATGARCQGAPAVTCAPILIRYETTWS